MRKLLISLIAVVTLGSGAAFAQTGTWAGVSAGFPGAALHFGVENVVTNLDVRANLGFSYAQIQGPFFGVDALYDLNLDTGVPPLGIYAGGGLNFAFGEEVAIVLGAFIGGEYRLVDADFPEGGVFFEAGPTFAFGTEDPPFGFAGRLGFNYHF